jgi:hypothetical protein
MACQSRGVTMQPRQNQQQPQEGEPVDFPIMGSYDKQRYVQFNPSDTANWYLVNDETGKKKQAMYPTMGRRHISIGGFNQLIFPVEPRGAFDSINYSYFVSVSGIYRVDSNFNQIKIDQGKVATLSGNIFFAFLVTPSVTFACFVDGLHIYVYREDTGSFDILSGIGVPANPAFIAAFGNRIVVSNANSTQFNLSEINLNGLSFDPTTAFSISGSSVFAQETGIIRQMAVLQNTLFIFTDYTTGIWSNTPSIFTSAGNVKTSFPWKKSTTSDFNFGIKDPRSLSIGFGLMNWMAQNYEGTIQVMVSNGGNPKRISTRAIDILFQKNTRQGIIGSTSPFLDGDADGFMYQWENTIFYRLSAGKYTGTGLLDIETNANSIEFNFETESWHRVIEKNGERNRIQKHVFYNNTHLVTVNGDNTVYEMSGQFFTNEITNPLEKDIQAPDAYLIDPFRYERVSELIFFNNYAEFNTFWVQIDFVWGENYNLFSTTPFANAEFIIKEALGPDGQPVYVIDEQPGPDGQPVYILAEKGNLPSANELTYNQIYKPHIELYWSDDGGIMFHPADVREFSPLGFYSWRMRWYQLGASRNRCYKLVCVSPSPIIVLGGIMLIERASGGAY